VKTRSFEWSRERLSSSLTVGLTELQGPYLAFPRAASATIICTVPIFDIFSKRKERLEKAGQPEVYQYDLLPTEFRTQVVHIWGSALGRTYDSGYETPAADIWKTIHDALSREYGVFALARGDATAEAKCVQHVLNAGIDRALDIIELSFVSIDRVVRAFDWMQRGSAGITQNADDAIQELNKRFQEHGIGYQYVEGKLVRVDSAFLPPISDLNLTN
jgi:hypothetical protein